MAKIETIFEGGGFIPMPEKSSNPGEIKPKEQDKLDETLDFVAKVVKTRALESLGSKPPEKGEDLAKVLEETINRRMAPIEAALKTFGEDKERKEFYTNVVEGVKNIVAAGQASKENPLETYEKVGQILGNVVANMKEHLGIGKEVQAQPSDIPNLLALENAKIEHDETRHQWEVEREERKHQWEIENKRWEQEHRLKVLEFSDSRKTKERATDALDDLVGSVIDSLETERGAAASESEAETSGAPRVRIPKSFKCKECGTIIEVARDHDLETPIVCQSCGAEYMLEEMQ